MNSATGSLYRTMWRWHFYAGLFVIPFVLVLSLSGAVYLFKPQIERWEERAFQGLPAAVAVGPSQQVAAALAAIPGATLHSYRLPQRAGDAAMVHVALADSNGMRDVFVSPQGEVLGSLDPDTRVPEVVRRIHGQLLLGSRGSWLVELAASWAIVMIVTGLYLWWPRGRGPAGVMWPRRRSLLRDLHAVTGFWVSGFVLVLLITGLPWAGAWGSAFSALRTEMGWVRGTPDWSIGGAPAAVADQHSGHEHSAMHAAHAHGADLSALDRFVTMAAAEDLAFPVLVLAPGAAQFESEPSPNWIIKSDAQNRPLRQTIQVDAETGAIISRERFADQHPVDRVVGYGIAWHEGQLFGWINQLAGVCTALALATMSVTAFLMWRRRRPTGALGAPAAPVDSRKPVIVAAAILGLAALLPLLAASLLFLWLCDWILPRISPATASWLGMAPSAAGRRR